MTESDHTWHPEYIKAEIRKRGTDLTQLARDNELDPSAVRAALCRPHHPRAEAVIARFVGRTPHELWPDRYDASNARIVGQARYKHIAQEAFGHGQRRAAA